jgi:hypothetical protein
LWLLQEKDGHIDESRIAFCNKAFRLSMLALMFISTTNGVSLRHITPY